jgi:hypothetical protein
MFSKKVSDMNINKAKKHLAQGMQEFGDNCLRISNLNYYLMYKKGSDKAILDGEFTIEDLEAITCYMKHCKGE